MECAGSAYGDWPLSVPCAIRATASLPSAGTFLSFQSRERKSIAEVVKYDQTILLIVFTPMMLRQTASERPVHEPVIITSHWVILFPVQPCKPGYATGATTAHRSLSVCGSTRRMPTHGHIRYASTQYLVYTCHCILAYMCVSSPKEFLPQAFIRRTKENNPLASSTYIHEHTCCAPQTKNIFHGFRQAPRLRAMSGTSTGDEAAKQQPLQVITPWGFKTKEEMQDISSIIENIGEEHASV